MGGSANPAMSQMPANRTAPAVYSGGRPMPPAIANDPYTQAANAQKTALAGTQAQMGYSPQQVRPTGYGATGYQSTGYNAAMQGGPATAASGMANYQNPFENQVVQASLRDIEGARQQAMNTAGAQATSANAFGGSRHGLVEAETNKNYTQQALDTASRLRSQGFNTALGASQFDVGQQQAVNAANQMAANQAAQFGAGAANTANQFGASAANVANQFGAQQGMTAQQLNQQAGLQANQQNLGAAQQMAGLGQQSFGYGQSIQNQQMMQGAMQQQMMQDLINAGKQQYAGYTGAPQQGLATFLGSISGVPNLQGQNQGYRPGFLDYFQAAGNFA